jgi:cell division septal protein FtsQ
MTSDPLERHRLSDLEDASRRLNSHISERKRRNRPSLTRRVVMLFISVPMLVIGLAIVLWAITTGHFVGPITVGGCLLLSAGGILIYSDWFE